MTDANYADGLVLLVNASAKAESLFLPASSRRHWPLRKVK